jgi:hypothetical protein
MCYSEVPTPINGRYEAVIGGKEEGFIEWDKPVR